MSNMTGKIQMINRLDDRAITATVIKVEWERIFLHLYVRVEVQDFSLDFKEKPLCFYLVSKDEYVMGAQFKVLGQDGNVYHIRLNVTNNGENRCVSAGEYYVELCQENAVLADCVTSTEIVPFIEDYSRNYLYCRGKSVYTVTFAVAEGEDDLPFIVTLLASAKSGMEFPGRNHLHKRFHPVKDIKETWLARKNMIRFWYNIFYKLHKSKRAKTVLFMTEQSDVIGSNMKAVIDRMLERGMDKEYRILCSSRAASAKSQGKWTWFSLVIKLARSGTVFLDDHAPCLDWLKLSDDTKVIQLWHAGAGFKSSGYSRWGHKGCPAVMSCHRQYSFGIAGSKNIVHFFSEVWGINDELVLPTGMPRMDEYLNPEYREAKTKELYELYPFCKDKKVILFAPTYRGNNKKTAFYPYERIDFDALYDLCGDEYVVLFKMHPWVQDEVPIKEEHKDKFADVGSFPNINDLFYITYLLITDYSSNIFEYSLMRNPMLFFAYDKIQYSFSRGFHRPYEESAPGKVCYTFQEVLEAIRKKDFELEKVQEYVDHHFDYIDSGASDRVIDWLLLGKIPEDLQNAIQKVEEENAYRKRLDFTFDSKRFLSKE